MGKSARRRREPALPKVERVELSEKHVGARFVAFVLCLTLGLGALGFGIWSLLSTDPGWVKIEANAGDGSCAGDLSFSYLFGEGGTAQRKVITTLYSEECTRLGRLFDPMESYDSNGLGYINTHPGEEVEADPLLYETLERLESAGDRSVYLGIANAYCLNLYYAGGEKGPGEDDPLEDPEARETVERLLDYAQGSVEVVLLGDGKLRLDVDPEYAEYAGELGLECFLDLGWLRNAVILDRLAEVLGERGYTQGVIASRDGYTRTLGGDTGTVERSLYRWDGVRAVETGRMELEMPVNAAAVESFPLPGDDGRAYVCQRVRLWGRELPAETEISTSRTKNCLELALER